MNEHVGAAMRKFSSLLLLRGVFVEHRLLDAPLCEEFPESHHLVLSAQLHSGPTSPRGSHQIAWQPRHKGPGYSTPVYGYNNNVEGAKPILPLI